MKTFRAESGNWYQVVHHSNEGFGVYHAYHVCIYKLSTLAREVLDEYIHRPGIENYVGKIIDVDETTLGIAVATIDDPDTIRFCYIYVPEPHINFDDGFGEGQEREVVLIYTRLAFCLETVPLDRFPVNAQDEYVVISCK